MQVSAIIAEYNPFHNGHKYHIDETKRLTDDSFVLAIMSGNFVQRGEPALLDKRERAKAALLNGADLVVELPLPWATASAERFARGAVYIAAQSGVTDYLSFGCENDDILKMQQIARILNDKVYSREIKNYYDEKMCSYPEARGAVIKEVLGEDCSEFLTRPNNILGVEYIKALMSFKSDIKPLAVRRNGGDHDSGRAFDNFSSAMNIRNLVKTGREYGNYIPENTFEILNRAMGELKFPSLYSRLETAILADLRKKQPKDFSGVPDVSEGIEYRIIQAVKTSLSLEELFDKVKTKRYTHARIRRIILNSFLGVTNDDISSLPPYIRVIGLNDNGRLMLKEMKKKFFFPIVMKYSDIQYLDDYAKRIFALESTGTDLYNLSLPRRRPCGTEMTDEVVYVPSESK